MLELVRPVELRYYLGSAHYRSVLEYSEKALTEAAAGYRRIEDFLQRVAGDAPEPAEAVGVGEWTDDFAEAMDEDLAVPRALAEIHRVVRRGNQHLAAGERDQAREAAESVRAMAGVLGLSLIHI